MLRTVTTRAITALIAISFGLVLSLSVGSLHDQPGETREDQEYDGGAARLLDDGERGEGDGEETGPVATVRVVADARYARASGAALVPFPGGLDAIFTPTPTEKTAREELLYVPRPAPSIVVARGPDYEERLALATLVCAAFPFDRYMCTHVVWAESLSGGSDCTWRSVVYGTCWSQTRDCGLLQTNEIHEWRYEALGYTMDIDCWIPERNIEVAQWIYRDQGPCAWTAYGC